jgi:hypothetical protein
MLAVAALYLMRFGAHADESCFGAATQRLSDIQSMKPDT